MRVNGLTSIALTKMDVLTGFDTIRIAVGYKLNGEFLDYFPMDPQEQIDVEPVYEDMPDGPRTSPRRGTWTTCRQTPCGILTASAIWLAFHRDCFGGTGPQRNHRTEQSIPHAEGLASRNCSNAACWGALIHISVALGLLLFAGGCGNQCIGEGDIETLMAPTRDEYRLVLTNLSGQMVELRVTEKA